MSKLDRHYASENRKLEEKEKREAAIRKEKDDEMWIKIRDVIIKIIPQYLIVSEMNPPPAQKVRWMKHLIYHSFYIVPWIWADHSGGDKDKLKEKYYNSYAWTITSRINEKIGLTTKGVLLFFDGINSSWYFIDLDDKAFRKRSKYPFYYNSTKYSGNPQNLRSLCQDLIDSAKTFGISQEAIDRFQKELDEIR